MNQDEQLLYENLIKILEGTFQAGLGALSLGKALGRAGAQPGWKMAAVAKYLEDNGDQIAMLAGFTSGATAQRMADIFAKRAKESREGV
jgi:hypothetical protein